LNCAWKQSNPTQNNGDGKITYISRYILCTVPGCACHLSFNFQLKPHLKQNRPSSHMPILVISVIGGMEASLVVNSLLHLHWGTLRVYFTYYCVIPLLEILLDCFEPTDLSRIINSSVLLNLQFVLGVWCLFADEGRPTVTCGWRMRLSLSLTSTADQQLSSTSQSRAAIFRER
jgi:hypothetical protein